MVIKRTNQLTGPRIRPAQGVTQTYFFLTRNICIHLILNQLNMSCVLFFQSFIYRTLQIWLLFTVLFVFHPCKRVLSFFSSRTGCGFLNNVNESCQSGVSVICHRSQRAPWRLWNVDSFQCGDFPLHLFRKKKRKGIQVIWSFMCTWKLWRLRLVSIVRDVKAEEEIPPQVSSPLQKSFS